MTAPHSNDVPKSDLVVTLAGLEPVPIGDAVDLNGITSTGLYHQPSTAHARNGANYPVQTAGLLRVAASSSMVYQLYIPFSTGSIFSRVKYVDTWTNWIEFSSVGHKHPVTDLTMTGTASSTTYLRGDGMWATPTNTTYSVMSEAEATAGTATTARAISAMRLKATIDYRMSKSINRKNVKDFGAVGDGVADDSAAIIAALDAAHADGGGAVYLPPGTYKVSRSIGRLTSGQMYANIQFTCDSHSSARVVASGNFAPLAGAWYRSVIENIFFDADLKGAPGMDIHMIESVVQKCLVDGWSGRGVILNGGTYGDVGLLNVFLDNHIVQRTGVGVFQTYRWVDSWIVDNNIGSTGENLSLEGGPVRVSGNHLNGAPQVNILLRGNKRVTITDNICEGARKEAIVYEMPPWLTEDDPQVIITGNNLSNGGKGSPGTYQAIRLKGVAGTTGLSGFSISNNIIACEDAGSGWSHAVGLHNAKQVVLLGNVWERGYTVAPVLLADGSPAPRSVGNTSGNSIPISDVTGLQASLDSKVAKAGNAATVWSGTQAQYDALPTATKNALGFIAVIR